MSLEVKICGVNSRESAEAAGKGGARLAGFVFYPPSPRAVTAEQAASLSQHLPPDVIKTALLVDAEDGMIEMILRQVKLDLLQLHGGESPQRVAEIKAKTGCQVMKVFSLARPQDLEAVTPYLPVIDRILFDAKPPKNRADALPGGNAVSFDWRILSGKRWPRPWMLAGGLKVENLKDAVEISGARAVDVSSGVESEPGRKSPEKITEFLALAKAL